VSIKTVFSVVAFVFVFGTYELQAQTLEQKVEVGLHYASINLTPLDSRRESGGGVRLSYNINDYLAVEAEGNIFEFAIGDHPTDDVLAVQGLIGVKAGLRNRRFGVFAKVRPGVANFPMLKVNRRFCSLILPCEGSGRSGSRFALDTGAVLEFYPTKKIILRFDVGDTMIRFKDDSLFRSSGLVRINDGFSHNFQWGVGVGFRF
jgi:hypothetical protein